jgi:hypothetical protein
MMQSVDLLANIKQLNASMQSKDHQQTALDGIATYRGGQGGGGTDAPCVTGKRQAEPQYWHEGPMRNRTREWVRAQLRVAASIAEAADGAQKMKATGQIVNPRKEGR